MADPAVRLTAVVQCSENIDGLFLRAKIAELEDELVHVKGELSRSKDENEELQLNLDGASREADGLAGEVRQLTHQLSEAIEARASLEGEMVSVRADRDLLKAENISLQGWAKREYGLKHLFDDLPPPPSAAATTPAKTPPPTAAPAAPVQPTPSTSAKVRRISNLSISKSRSNIGNWVFAKVKNDS